MIPVHRNRVLIMRRSGSAPQQPLLWDFPGGMVQQGESPEKGAVRELEEESGLVARPEELKKIGSFDENGLRIHLFRLDLRGRPSVRLRDGEHDRYAWTPPCQIECYDLARGVERSVKDNKDLIDLWSSSDG